MRERLGTQSALALAVFGVYLLTDVELEGEPVGLVLAFLNAALFALYIVLAHRLSRIPGIGRIDGLAAAMLVAAVCVTPLAGWSAAPALLDPVALAAGIGVGIASSVVPYVFDQLAMARLRRATYSLLVSLLPATATVVGILVLSQLPPGSRSREWRSSSRRWRCTRSQAPCLVTQCHKSAQGADVPSRP